MGETADHQVNNYLIQSMEDKMKRVGHELHEGVNQRLYSVSIGLEFLQSMLKGKETKKYADELSSLLNRTIREVRLLSLELYPNTLATLGLASALKSYSRLFTSTFGIIVHHTAEGQSVELAESAGLVLFRSCQEVLLNIAEYADIGEAFIHFTWEEKCVTIDIVDFGNQNSFHREMRMQRIAAVEQRMYIAGGCCKVYAEEGKGTTVSLRLPI